MGVLKNILHKDKQKAQKGEKVDGAKVFCFGGQESFVPKDLVQVLTKRQQLKDAMTYWESHREGKPLDRIAYHLFNSNVPVGSMTRAQLFDTNTVLGTLYTRSFAKVGPDEPSLQLLNADALPWATVAKRVDSATRAKVLSEECNSFESASNN